MKQKLDSQTCAFGASRIAEHLHALSREIENARQSGNVEHIHKLRVYSRRLRSTMPLFKSCLPPKKRKYWNQQIKLFNLALGEARDLDVQLKFLDHFCQRIHEKKYKAGVERLILRLSQKRKKAQSRVIEALDEFEASGTIEEMNRFYTTTFPPQDQSRTDRPGLFCLASQAIYKAWRAFIAYEAYMIDPEKVQELHQMRIASKTLRYTVEIFEPFYKGAIREPYRVVRQSQEMLGSIHDMDIWAGFIPKFIEQEREITRTLYGQDDRFNNLLPGLEAFEAYVKTQREQYFQQFMQNWLRWKESNVWQSLLETIGAAGPCSDPVSDVLPSED